MKIAIIGSGIGGCAAAFFANKFIENCSITIFEKNDRIGGRLFNKKIGNVQTELGAEFFHSVNLNMKEFVERFNLDVEEYVFPTLGVWNGSKFIYKSGENNLINNLKLLLRYRMSTIRLLGVTKKARKKVLELYENNRFDQAYNNVDSLLGVPYIQNLMRSSLYDVCRKEGISDKLIKEILEPGVRLIYGQNMDVGGFAGIATIIASDGTPILKLKDGNVTVAKKLIENGNIQVILENTITSLQKLPDGRIQLAGSQIIEEAYDAVIIAAPLEQLKLKFINIDVPKIEMRDFHKLYIKLIVV